MSEYFRVERPTGPAVPIVVDVPHAGEWIPDEVPGDMLVGIEAPRRDLDLYTDRIWDGAPAVGATMIVAAVSRYVVDLNRASDDISPKTVAGGRRISLPGYYQDRGVVWRTTTDGRAVMPRAMTPEDFEKRLELFWEPYHAALAAEIERVRDEFGICILVDGHSMPSLGRSANGDQPIRRADIVPGDAAGKSCDRRLTQAVLDHFSSHGYSSRPNDPYKGGWITRNYGRPSEGVHAIQIEVNRDLYMDERSFEPKERGLTRLAEACVSLLPSLAELVDELRG